MKNNRRDFLKAAGLAGVGLTATGWWGCNRRDSESLNEIKRQSERRYTQQFNMSGYGAPKLDTVRIGFIGLGMRGPGAVKRMNLINGVEINALCDIRPDRVDNALKILANTVHTPAVYSDSTEAWKELCASEDIDLVYIATPWHLHTPMAVYAMEQGKHVAVEVPAATIIDDCWLLVETSERTRKHCMMLENCCYDFFELLTLNMARQGFFGELIHGEGAYIHDLLEMNFSKEKYQDMWRLKENARHGNLYPTHGLGPVCQAMNINRGDRMDYLVSMAGGDFSMGAKSRQLASEDEFYKEFERIDFRGNMNTTIIRTVKNRTIMVQHDVSSPRPYSRIHLLSGTKAMARKWPEEKIARGHKWFTAEEFKNIEEEFTPEISLKMGEMAKQIGGHGGMDFLMDWRLIDCLRNGLPFDQDVYDAALWSAIAPLSEWSVANRSMSIDAPDFTAGFWKNNQPVDISLRGGGTTSVRV